MLKRHKIRTRLWPQGVDNPTQRDFENYLKGDETPQGNFKQANDCVLVIYCCLTRTSKLSSSKQPIFIILQFLWVRDLGTAKLEASSSRSPTWLQLRHRPGLHPSHSWVGEICFQLTPVAQGRPRQICFEAHSHAPLRWAALRHGSWLRPRLVTQERARKNRPNRKLEIIPIFSGVFYLTKVKQWV